MKRRSFVLFAALVAMWFVVTPVRSATASSRGTVDACGLPAGTAAFCKALTVDHSATNPPSNSRSGALNGKLWGTSDEGDNPAKSLCGGTVTYPNNIQICHGHLTDSENDGGEVTAVAMYPRQPFNFAAGGSVVFDVSNDTQGSHAAWPELWVTDQPVPAPFTHDATLNEVPHNGFGIRFNGCTDGSGIQAPCPSGNGTVGVQSAVVVQNYLADDSTNPVGGITVIGDGNSVVESPPGYFNHYQVHINAAGNRIEVYGTNPFPQNQRWNPARDPLLHIATLSGFGSLGLTQGLVWLEDVHYNGNKFGTQGNHSFQWGHLGFTGPVEPRDLGFDVPINEAGCNCYPYQSDGYGTRPGTSVTLKIPDVPATTRARPTGALLVFDFWVTNSSMDKIRFNGCDVSVRWPFRAAQAAGQADTYTPSALAVSVPLSCVEMGGTNKVTFADASASQTSFDVANIDLILKGAGGRRPVR